MGFLTIWACVSSPFGTQLFSHQTSWEVVDVHPKTNGGLSGLAHLQSGVFQWISSNFYCQASQQLFKLVSCLDIPIKMAQN